MKPGALQLVCFSALLLRNPPLLLNCKACSSFQAQAGQSCPRPTRPWLAKLTLPQCRTHDTVQYNHHRTWSSMSHPESDFAKHNMCRFVDSRGTGDATDVIVAGQRSEAKEHVIFFGGDVQDYPENMQSHRDNGKYVRWNSLATAGQLCERFPTAMVLVIKPHHMHLKTFSVYSQFVESNDFGCPSHTLDFGAWQTLMKVYKESVSLALDGTVQTHSSCVHIKADASAKCSSGSGSPESGSGQSGQSAGAQTEGTVADGSEGTVADGSSDETAAKTPEVPVHLIGFSKGCIVLNQLVHELESVQTNSVVQDFVGRVQAMTWLDGGHSGGSNTWVTDQATLEHLATLGIAIHVHVTPYQVKDPMRRWIGKEERRFVELLRKAGAKVTDKLHFEDEPRSIENHFRVLEAF